MGNTLRYEGFRNVLISQLRKRLTGKSRIKRISRREAVKNNDTVMEMLLVELEDGRAAPILYLQDLYKTYQEGADIEEILQGLCELSLIWIFQRIICCSPWKRRLEFEWIRMTNTLKCSF